VATQDAAQSSGLRDSAAQDRAKAQGLLRMGWRTCRFGSSWARLLMFDRRAGLEELVDMVMRSEFFPAQQVPSELRSLGEILQALRPAYAMEIGTWKGGTLFFLTRLASPRAKIISVDLPGGRYGGGYSGVRAWLYRRFAHREQQLHLFRGDSHSGEMLAIVKRVLGGQPLDYLFIDGDHAYEGVKRDFELYAPLVGKGGVIAFHDIADHPAETRCEVSLFWNEIRLKYRHAEIVADQGQGWAGIGVLYVD
jgi:predicted O-methyltransferase YrrM